MRDYTKIIAWQKADDLVLAIYETTGSFPREEIYAITSQVRKAAYSVPSNIAEGASRNSKKDYLHFLYIARGSLAELGYFIHLTQRLGYLTGLAHERLVVQVTETSRTLYGLIKAVERETSG